MGPRAIDQNHPDPTRRWPWTGVLIAAVAGLAAWRSMALLTAPDLAPVHIPAAEIRAVLLSAGEPTPPADALATLGVTMIEYQRFDPQALLVATPGPDQQPGRAGADDNFNGIVDDRAELGATYSDDVCRVLTADQADDLPADTVMVLQQGAFVPADEKSWSRAIVSGQTDGEAWSMVVSD